MNPALYIGLGGSGIQTIAHIKKLFEDEYGERNIPECIQFLAIDFDMNICDSPSFATGMHEDFVSPLLVRDYKAYYDSYVKEANLRWIPQCNYANIPNGQITISHTQSRTTGRFFFELLLSQYEAAIFDRIDAIIYASRGKGSSTCTQPAYVHVVTSLCGATGAGVFLNVADLIREQYREQICIIGYGILHNVFCAMDPTGLQTPRVLANAYASVVDLDYLMTANPINPIKVSFNGYEHEIIESIYDEFYLIDNKTTVGERINIQELRGRLAIAIYTSSQGSCEYRCVMDNISWKYGQYDVGSKIGWVQGLGACQVVYKGEELANIYSLQAAIQMIRNLQCADMGNDWNQTAIDWMVENNIREDGMHHQLIDSIYNLPVDSVPLVRVDIKDTTTDIKVICEKYMNNLPAGFLTEQGVKKRIIVLQEALKIKIESILQTENGVANLQAFLASLQTNLTFYRTEMNTKRLFFEKRGLERQKAFDAAYKAYVHYANQFWKRSTTQDDYLESVREIAQKVLVEHVQAVRCKVAVDVFTTLLSDLAAWQSKAEILHNNLMILQKQYADNLLEIQMRKRCHFEYDLSLEEQYSMRFTPTDTFYDAFFDSLNNSLCELDLDALSKVILSYCGALSQSKFYRERCVLDVIEELSEADYDSLKRAIMNKSSCLLGYNDKGFVNNVRRLPTDAICTHHTWKIFKGSEHNKLSRIERDIDFLSRLNMLNGDIGASEGFCQKIFFTRVDQAIIPYCINSFDSRNALQKEYYNLLDNLKDGHGYNPHIDQQLFEQMQAMDFNLKPNLDN